MAPVHSCRTKAQIVLVRLALTGIDKFKAEGERGAVTPLLNYADEIGLSADEKRQLALGMEASLGTELRWELVSALARSVVEEMDCAKPPVIPSALPAAT